ncbi:hypothetical protein CL655_01960 [bacterium]|nr:hypothetical protein [bacterium]|tara:strand:- start:231 stop:986 length:756 start_codon:yes stop_codon:yes gene_type:complete
MSGGNRQQPEKTLPPASQRNQFLTAREAAKYVTYSADYISRLAREGKLLAEQRGRQWYVSLDALKRFSLEQQAEQRARQELLREQRLQEYAHTRTAAMAEMQRQRTHSQVAPAALLTAVVGMCLLVLVSVGWFGYRQHLQVADVRAGLLELATSLQSSIPVLDWLISKSVAPSQPAELVPSHQVYITSTGVQVADGTALDAVLSDPVRVSEVGTSSLIIEPIFLPQPQPSYLIELVPRTIDPGDELPRINP